MSDLRPEVKAAWVAALRSGKYKQAQAVLHSDKGFCCLGVLCDISGLGQWVPATQGNTWSVMAYLTPEHRQTASLPADVDAWASIEGNTRFHRTVKVNGRSAGLAQLNDQWATFAQIADAIEEQL